jgi:hypothetical protein
VSLCVIVPLLAPTIDRIALIGPFIVAIKAVGPRIKDLTDREQSEELN